MHLLALTIILHSVLLKDSLAGGDNEDFRVI